MTRTHLTAISKGALRQPPMRKDHANRLELLRRGSFGFVSIALPFKSGLTRVNVEEFLDAHQLEYTDGPTVCKLKYCPFCPKAHNNERTNLHTLHIQKDYGYFHCFRCSSKGSWL
jgi:hypothetical protein